MKEKTWGVLLCFLIAILSIALSSQTHFLSASVLALLIGILCNTFFIKKATRFTPGIQYTSKKLLKIAIIFLGASLQISHILYVGRLSIVVMIFTLTAAFGGGYLLGRLLGLDWKLSSLISAGTGVCGGSAIAALSPVIEADDSHVAYAISATFIFDILMVILFPIMGSTLGLSDLAYGLWVGTAVNDTSSVVAASYAFSDAAGEFATIVKLTRTLSIVPIILIFSIVNTSITKKSDGKTSRGIKDIRLKEIFPWFILLFIGVAILNSIGIISPHLSQILKLLSRLFMVMALGAIGLKTNLSKLKEAGIKPLAHGFSISLLVVAVSLGVQIILGYV